MNCLLLLYPKLLVFKVKLERKQNPTSTATKPRETVSGDIGDESICEIFHGPPHHEPIDSDS